MCTIIFLLYCLNPQVIENIITWGISASELSIKALPGRPSGATPLLFELNAPSIKEVAWCLYGR
jgi:hypothetical protein